MEIKVTSLHATLKQLPDWGHHLLPRFPLEDPRAGHGCFLAAPALLYSTTAVNPALPGTRNISFPTIVT